MTMYRKFFNFGMIRFSKSEISITFRDASSHIAEFTFRIFSNLLICDSDDRKKIVLINFLERSFVSYSLKLNN